MNLTSEGQTNVANQASLQHDSSSWMAQFTPGRLAVLIAIFLFVLYPGVVLGTHSFFFRDFGAFTYPLAYYAHVNFWHGRIPLWNPLDNCGIPFLAQWNTSVCYPFSLIFMVFPLPQSLNYFCLGHLVLAGVGMYFLAYHWTQNRLAASVAGLVFALNGLLLNSLEWVSTLAALSWQPWVVLWVERAWRDGGRRLVIAALVGAMQMLAGTPEVVVMTWAILGLLWLGQVWRKQVSFWLALRRFVCVVVVIVGLSAIQLLPFFDLLEHSERNSAYSASTAYAWAMPLWGWANFVVPVFHSLPAFFGTRVQPNVAWASSYYLGIGTITLTVVALWRRQWEIYALAGITFAGVALAFGKAGYVYTWLEYVAPWIGFARYPIKFLCIPAFTIPLLAACGFDAFQHPTFQDVKRAKRVLILIAVCLLLAVVVILAVARWDLAAKYDWPMTWRDGALRVLCLIALVGLICALIRIPPSRLRSLVGLAVLVVIGLDLITAGMSENPVVVTKAFGPLELNLTSHPESGKSRVMVSRQALSYLDLHSAATKNPLYYYVGIRDALIEDCNIPENIPKLDGFYPLHIKNEWDINEIFYSVHRNFHGGGYSFGTNALPTPLLDFLGVSHISAPNTIFAWRARKSFLPLATAGQRPIFADTVETMHALESTNFDPRHTVYLPLSARSKITVTNGSKAKVIFQQFGVQSVHLTVQAPAAALVVIAQSFYHDWHAYVDGKSVPVLRANHAFQAVQIPTGRHEITLRYEDRWFHLGALISGLALLGCLAGLFVVPNAERRANHGSPGGINRLGTKAETIIRQQHEANARKSVNCPN